MGIELNKGSLTGNQGDLVSVRAFQILILPYSSISLAKWETVTTYVRADRYFTEFFQWVCSCCEYCGKIYIGEFLNISTNFAHLSTKFRFYQRKIGNINEYSIISTNWKKRFIFPSRKETLALSAPAPLPNSPAYTGGFISIVFNQRF
jgi:hypothetical protein